FSHKDLSVLKGAANTIFRFYREALRSTLNLNDASFKALLKKELDSKENQAQNNEDVSINNNFEDSNKDGDFKDLPINNDSFEDDNIDGSLEDISSNNSGDNLENMLINNIELEESNYNFED
ncbi:24482_t:CDS:2, partial [Racocetra persica]